MDWLSKVTVLCFWASYAVTLAFELSRLLFQSRVRRLVLLGFAAAGLLAHTIYMVHSGVSAQKHLPPLSSLSDWLLMVSWLLVALYLYLAICYRELALGVFLLPIVLGLVAAGWLIEPAPRKLDNQFWVVLHAGLVALGSVAVVAATLAGSMYLVQSSRLKRKRTPVLGFALPNLELLERVNHRALTIAFALLSLGFGLGVVLAWAHGTGAAVTPTLVIASLVWVAFAVLLHLQHLPRWRGRKDAWLSIVAFLLLFGMVLMELDLGRLHGRSETSSESRPARATQIGRRWNERGRHGAATAARERWVRRAATGTLFQRSFAGDFQPASRERL